MTARDFRAWMADWRTGAAFAGLVAASAFLALVIGLLSSRQQALDSLDRALAQLEMELQREEGLQDRVTDLTSQVAGLTLQVQVLADQLESAGLQPAVELGPPDVPPPDEVGPGEDEASFAAPRGPAPPRPDPAPPDPQPAAPPPAPARPPDPPAEPPAPPPPAEPDPATGPQLLEDVSDTVCTLTPALC